MLQTEDDQSMGNPGAFVLGQSVTGLTEIASPLYLVNKVQLKHKIGGVDSIGEAKCFSYVQSL